MAHEYDRLVETVASCRPETIVHFAEQRAAPYSMKSPRHKRYTIDNNVNATHNVLAALVEADVDAHVVLLGTMGVYGYKSAGATIPEGYLTVGKETARLQAGKEARVAGRDPRGELVYRFNKLVEDTNTFARR